MHAIYVATITRRGQSGKYNGLESIQTSFYFGSTATAVVQVNIYIHPSTFLNLKTSLSIFQAFYANRLKKCLDKPYLGILCWFLTIFRFAAFVVESVLDGVLKTKLLNQWGSITGYFIEATVDFIITTSLCYYLIQNRRSCIHTRLECLTFYNKY